MYLSQKGSTMLRTFSILALMLAAPPAFSQSFTTAAEVKPILEMQKDRWVALREYEGQDWVYFTPVLSWRCGLEAVHYGLNGAPAETLLEMEACHEDTAAPNAMLNDTHPIYLTAPLGSVESVTLRLTYDDGSSGDSMMERKSVLMP